MLRWPSLRHACLVFIVSVFIWPAAVKADFKVVVCEAYALTVVAEDLSTAQRACDALADQRPLFNDCGLIPARPYTLRIVREIEEGPGACLALYHCDDNALEVIGPDWLASAIEPGSVLERLDPDALFASLVVHEWSHAVFDEVTGRAARDLGDQEYVAFSMQLAALPPDELGIWLSAYPATGLVQPREVNALIAALDPLRFAARAWRHFEADGHGCTTIRALISGDLTFRLGRF